MFLTQRLVFHGSDRLSGSDYGSPIFAGINMPQSITSRCDYVKVRLLNAQIGCEVASGGDDSRIEVFLKDKAPMNGTRCSGTGSTQSYELGYLISHFKETSGARLYVLPHETTSYLIYPVAVFDNTNLEFEIKDGKEVGLVQTPSTDAYDGYVITLEVEGIPRD